MKSASSTQNNVNLPAGALYGKDRQFTVQANSQLSSATQFRPMIIAYRNSNPVRLEHVATKPQNANGARKILFYRNPMGLPDTSPVPKKDAMGMDYIPVHEGDEPTMARP